MNKQAKHFAQFLLFMVFCLPQMSVHAAEDEIEQDQLAWHDWLSWDSVWQLLDSSEEEEALSEQGPISLVKNYNNELGFSDDNMITSLMAYGSENLIIDFAQHRHQFTAAVNLATKDAFQFGVGVTHDWSSQSVAQQQDSEYLSFIVRYAF